MDGERAFLRYIETGRMAGFGKGWYALRKAGVLGGTAGRTGKQNRRFSGPVFNQNWVK
jgi:hypothetical protein